MNLQAKAVSHRLSTCRRHPSKPVTGFCAFCLRERLAGIHPDTRQESPVRNLHSSSELRRSKSFSAAKREAGIGQPEVQHRNSCDARSGSSLSDLFCCEDKTRCTNREVEIASESLGYQLRTVVANEKQFRASKGATGPALDTIDNFAEEGDAEFKTMKEFIDLEFRRKKNAGRDLREIAGSVWEAASVFSKKLGKWRKKQQMKNLVNDSNVDAAKTEAIKPRVLEVRETRSEIGEYGLGRRSCDTDPRFSVDTGRMSFDDSRYSFDEPRASWDGYLIGRTYPRLTPMVSVLEESKLPGIGFEKEDSSNEAEGSPMNTGEKIPGGSAETKDYYMDALSTVRRRKSFDRSSSHRKGTSADFDDLKLISNAKVSPATRELFYGAKVITEKDLNSSRSKALRDGDLSGNDVGSKYSVPNGAGNDRKMFKKGHRWRKVLSVLGMMQKQSGESKSDDEESCVGGNVVDPDRPFAESWEKLRRVTNGEANGSVSQKLIRSYSVSCRDPSKLVGFNGGGNDSKLNGLRRRDDCTLQRNRSVRYSPNNFDNGLLRFYLTPLRSYNRGRPGKSRPRSSPFNVKHVM